MYIPGFLLYFRVASLTHIFIRQMAESTLLSIWISLAMESKNQMLAGDMAQQLIALAALTEGLGLM